MHRLHWGIIGVVLLVGARAHGLTPKEIYKQASPGVVLILGSDDGKAGSGGTGSIIDEKGRIVTNAHVVISSVTNKPFAHLYVFLKPDKVTGDNGKDLKRRYKAEVIAHDPADNGLDLALLRLIDGPANLPKIGFTDPDVVDIGDQVVAIGHPEQGGLWTLTTGSVSTLIANYGRVPGKDVFQTEASVNRGNSGGPLLDQQGQMVGINTMIARQAADGVAITAVNFSLKSSVAVKWLQKQGVQVAYSAPAAQQNQMLASNSPATNAPAPAPALTPSPTPAPAQLVSKEQAPTTQAMAAIPPSPASPPNTTPGKGASGSTVQQLPVQTVKTTGTPSNTPPSNSSSAPQSGTNQPTKTPSNTPPPNNQVTPVTAKAPNAAPSTPTAPQEVVVKGKPLDPATAKPVFVTPKRPFQMDALAAKQMAELENMMQEFGRGGKTNGRGMGLW